MPPNFRQAGGGDRDLGNPLLPTGTDGYASP
jgi:hypothetical protein